MPFLLTIYLSFQTDRHQNVIGGLTGKTCTCAARLGLAGQTAVGRFAGRMGKTKNDYRRKVLYGFSGCSGNNEVMFSINPSALIIVKRLDKLMLIFPDSNN